MDSFYCRWYNKNYATRRNCRFDYNNIFNLFQNIKARFPVSTKNVTNSVNLIVVGVRGELKIVHDLDATGCHGRGLLEILHDHILGASIGRGVDSLTMAKMVNCQFIVSKKT